MSRTLVVGLGNETRGDDAAGLLAARAVCTLGLAGVDVEEHGDVAGLAEAIARHSDVVLFDAVAGGTPGAVVEVELGALRRVTTSSHGLDAGEAVDLARVLGSQARVRVIGIVGRCFETGAPPSAEVTRAAAAAALRIKEVLPCA